MGGLVAVSAAEQLCDCGSPAVRDGQCFACHRFEEAYLASPPFTCLPGAEWLAGDGMDPLAVSSEPAPALVGFPFLYPGAGALIVGPTGGGRSSLVQACAYRAAREGLRVGYLGHEVTLTEFNDRAARLAALWGDEIDDALRVALARVRYLDLASVIVQAWEIGPEDWSRFASDAFDVLIVDPLSAVESALDLNFEQKNHDLVRWWDRFVQPLTAKGTTVVVVDNVGHAIDAKGRAKGASAKQDRADLVLSCAVVASPAVGLVVRARKVRSVRAPFRAGDEWMFLRDTQTIERRDGDEAPAGGFRPTNLMERVSRFVEAEPGASGQAIREAVKGKREFVDAAVDRLVDEGFAERKKQGRRQAHRSIRPFREDPSGDRPAPWGDLPNSALDSEATGVFEVGPAESGESRAFELAPSSPATRPEVGPDPRPTNSAARPGYVVPGEGPSSTTGGDANATAGPVLASLADREPQATLPGSTLEER